MAFDIQLVPECFQKPNVNVPLQIPPHLTVPNVRCKDLLQIGKRNQAFSGGNRVT
jgi:hypothetical protein